MEDFISRDLDISLLIRQQDEDAALDALHKAFAV